MSIKPKGRIHCPRCGELIAFEWDVPDMPEIRKMTITIGKKTYPVIDIPKKIPLTLTCPSCGWTKTKIVKTGR